MLGSSRAQMPEPDKRTRNGTRIENKNMEVLESAADELFMIEIGADWQCTAWSCHLLVPARETSACASRDSLAKKLAVGVGPALVETCCDRWEVCHMTDL